MRANWGLLAVLVGALAAIPAAGADEPPTRRELVTSQNNLKQIAIAFHNHASTFNDKWPDDIRDMDGKALLSWRVAILPYIEQDALYKEFKLDEAWDSVANKKLVEKMPKLYAPVRVKAKAGETFYQTFTGKDTIFGDKGPIYTVGNIPDGTSNTALVVEAGEPVIWSKPGDIAFDQQKPLPKLGGLFDGVFHVALADGSVMRVKKDPDATELKKLIMPADGNVIDLKKLQK